MPGARPKSDATKLHNKAAQKMTGVIVKLSVIIPLILLIVYLFLNFGVWTQGSTNARGERRAAEAAAASARAEQVALARTRVNEELLRFDQGTWMFQGHTTGNEREVIMDSFSVDRDGNVKEFVFKYSLTRNGEAYANTWNCEVSQMQRYDCTVRQQYDGGSWRNEGYLRREDESSFSGQYLYERQWYPVSLVRKEKQAP
jgi:hypothetical protein